ncbi:MAG: Gp15 family bacteriophage protein [Eubacteriales bacterium]|nr:Gp15 family bacteriophage protein [Christensenellaceae bacterium]MEA5067162.1 Gp15 family bacteriophage protein [Eubacteriales bacterium]
MRPNYAQDAPPTTITVGGFAYPVDADFRTWICVTRMMRDFIPSPDTPEHMRHNADLLCEIQTAVFGGVLADEDAGDVLGAISAFAQGYPTAPTIGAPKQGPPTYSFEYDLNQIVLAIRNQSGIDLSYRRKEPFHWWEFLLEFGALCGDHVILRLMEIRGYEGKDAEMLHQRARYALPREAMASDQVALDEINDEFYNA